MDVKLIRETIDFLNDEYDGDVTHMIYIKPIIFKGCVPYNSTTHNLHEFFPALRGTNVNLVVSKSKTGIKTFESASDLPHDLMYWHDNIWTDDISLMEPVRVTDNMKVLFLGFACVICAWVLFR